MFDLKSVFNKYTNEIKDIPYVASRNAVWSITTTSKPRVQFYYASRPGKRWKK